MSNETLLAQVSRKALEKYDYVSPLHFLRILLEELPELHVAFDPIRKAGYVLTTVNDALTDEKLADSVVPGERYVYYILVRHGVSSTSTCKPTAVGSPSVGTTVATLISCNFLLLAYSRQAEALTSAPPLLTILINRAYPYSVLLLTIHLVFHAFASGFSSNLQRAIDTVSLLFHNSAGEVLPFVVFEIIKLKSFMSALESSETSKVPKRELTSKDSIRLRKNNRVSLNWKGNRTSYTPSIDVGTIRRFSSVRGNTESKIQRGSVALWLDDDYRDNDDEGGFPTSTRTRYANRQSLRFGGQTPVAAFKSERVTRKDGFTIYVVKNISQSKLYFHYNFFAQINQSNVIMQMMCAYTIAYDIQINCVCVQTKLFT